MGMGDEKVTSEILQRLVRIETKVDGYNEVRDGVVELKAAVAGHERRIGGIESWGKWLAAGVGIALLQAVLSLVMG
jgi:hypothetical protein